MKVLFPIILVAIGLFDLKVGFAAEDPSYNGKSVSVWVAQLGFKQSQEVRDQAEEAVRQIGTNSLPFLLRELRVLGQAQRTDRTNFYNTPAMVDRMMNVRSAFKTLGSTAKPAIPELMKLLNDGLLPDSAAHSLIQIDPQIASVALVKALTNKDHHVSCAAANNLYSVATNAEMAVPVLLQTLNDRSPDTNGSRNLRAFSANALGAIGKAPEKTVPALIKCLEQDENPYSRTAAARALAKFGTNAHPALPALRQASTNDPVVRIRPAMIQAIQAIEGQTP